MNNVYKKFVEYRERLFTFTFAVIAVILSSMIATGFTFSLEELYKVSFYLKTISNFFLMITIFNMVKMDIVREDKLNPKSDYFQAKQRTDRYVKQIHDGHLEELVDVAVEEENKLRFKKACVREVNRYVHDIKLKDDNTIDYGVDPNTKKPLTQDEYFALRGITKRRQKRKIKKSILNALTGNVYYIEISSYEILNGFTNLRKNGCDDAEMAFDETKENIKENRNKSISFLLIAIFMAIIGYDTGIDDWWLRIFSEVFVMITSCLSACMVGFKHIRKMTKIEINRATFLNNIIKDEQVTMALPTNEIHS